MMTRIDERPGAANSRIGWCLALPFATVLALLAMRPFFLEEGMSRLPRGDVAIDAAVAHSLAAGEGFWTPWERTSCYRLAPEGERFGYPADQHPPLWPLAGALFIRIFGCSPGEAMAWASFAAHLAVLALMMLLGRDLGLGRWTFLPALVYALSSIGSAFSFNGSLYAAQGVLYLLAARLAGLGEPGIRRSLLLGVVTGGAYLLNYQAVLLLPALIALRLLLGGRERLRPRHLGGLGLTLAAFAATLAPWLMRNGAVFGDPFYSVNHYYALAKAGVSMAHRPTEAGLVLVLEPYPLSALAKGFAHCAWINIPYLLVLLLGLFPGCLAVMAAATPAFKERIFRGTRDPLAAALVTVLAVHLAACLIWPALKLRYIVPAAPLLLLLAWRLVLDGDSLRRGWAVGWTLLLGGFSAAAWLKGSRHGEDLILAFLLGFASMSLVLLIVQRATGPEALRRLPGICLFLLAFSAAGTLPGAAYFNIPPYPDFFGQDKEILERKAAGELERIAGLLEKRKAGKVMGDMRLWCADPALQVVEPPKVLPGEDYAGIIRREAARRSIRYVVLDRELRASLQETIRGALVWEGSCWTLVELRPPSGDD